MDRRSDRLRCALPMAQGSRPTRSVSRIGCIPWKSRETIRAIPTSRQSPLTVLINPEITFLSDETFENYEGCLSVPNLRGAVNRHLGGLGSRGTTGTALTVRSTFADTPPARSSTSTTTSTECCFPTGSPIPGRSAAGPPLPPFARKRSPIGCADSWNSGGHEQCFPIPAPAGMGDNAWARHPSSLSKFPWPPRIRGATSERVTGD